MGHEWTQKTSGEMISSTTAGRMTAAAAATQERTIERLIKKWRSIYTVSQKNVTLFIFVKLNQMSCNFVNSWQKHTPGNLEQTQMHREPHLISCVRTVPCKI